MSKYIDVEDLEKELSKAPVWTTLAVKEIIDEAPSIDIVRCKECKHNYNTAINHGKMQPRCDFMDAKLRADDFCSYGQKR